MKYSIVLAAVVAAAALGIVPTAAATQEVCVDGSTPPCVRLGSQGYGSEDCSENGSTRTNFVRVDSGETAAGAYAASVTNTCYKYSSWWYTYTYHDLSARASAKTPVGNGDVFAFWTEQGASSDWSSYKSCSQGVTASFPWGGTFYTPAFGCPLGTPPQAPPVLP